MDAEFIEYTAAGKALFSSAVKLFPEKAIDHENVNSTQRQFQMDDLQAWCGTLKATIHTTCSYLAN